jgi:hypothetical protein
MRAFPFAAGFLALTGRGSGARARTFLTPLRPQNFFLCWACSLHSFLGLIAWQLQEVVALKRPDWKRGRGLGSVPAGVCFPDTHVGTWGSLDSWQCVGRRNWRASRGSLSACDSPCSGVIRHTSHTSRVRDSFSANDEIADTGDIGLSTPFVGVPLKFRGGKPTATRKFGPCQG